MPAGIETSSGLGLGEAQVYDKGLNTTDALQYALSEKKRKEVEAQTKQKAAQKAMGDIYDTVDEVNVTGYLPHVNYLTKQKDQIRGYLTDKYVQTQGKYNPNTDPVVGKLVSNLKKENQMSTQIKEYAKQLPTMLTKENAKHYTDDSILEVDKFLKLPLDQQVKYVEDNGSYPLPQPKPEVIDYDKNIDEIGKGLSEKSTTIEKPKSEGGTQTVTTSGYDPKNVELYAKSYITAGIEGRRPDAANLLQATKKRLDSDIVFQAMSPEDQQRKVMQEAEKYVTKRLYAGEKKDYKETLQADSGGSGQKANYSVTPVTKTINVNFPETQKEGEGQTYVPKDVTVKSHELKSNIPIQKEVSEVINPETWTKEKPVGGQQFVMSSVIELPVYKEGKYKGKPMSDEEYKKYPALGEMKKMASGTIKKKVQQTDDKGFPVIDMFTGQPKTTLQDSPAYIDYSVVKPVLEEKKIKLEESSAPEKSDEKNISLAQARSANPGKSDKELIEGYKKHGYTVK